MATKKDTGAAKPDAPAEDPTIGTGGANSETGDHWAPDLEGSYRDNPDKPDPSSVAQVQDPPEGWPGT